MIGFVSIIDHGGDRAAAAAGGRRCTAGGSRAAVSTAPFQGIVVTTDEFLDGSRVGIAGRVGNPRKGGGGVAVRPSVGHLVAEAALDEPLTIFGAGGEGMIDDLDSGREQHG